MPLRPPRILHRQTSNSLETVLHADILEEKAASLGRAGELVEKRLAELRACGDNEPSRPDLVQAAADAVYAYFIQRELCGLRNQDAAIRTYKVPPEVLAILGSSPRRTSAD